MHVVDSPDDMEPEKSDGHLIEDHCPHHHLWMGGLIVIMIQFYPEAWLFQAFLVSPTNLSKPMVAAKQGGDPVWRLTCPSWRMSNQKMQWPITAGDVMWPFTDQGVETKVSYQSWQGFPWVLAQSFGEDATWQEVLQMLDNTME